MTHSGTTQLSDFVSENNENLEKLKSLIDTRFFTNISCFSDDFSNIESRNVNYLINNVSNYPWLNQVAFYAVSASTENIPGSVYSIMVSLHTTFKWANSRNISVNKNMNIPLLLHNYANSHSRIITKVIAFNSAKLCQQRYLDKLPKGIKETIEDILLPDYDLTDFNLIELSQDDRNIAKKNRAKKTKPIKKRLPNLVSIARNRCEVMLKLFEKLEDINNKAFNGDIHFPHDIEIPNERLDEKINLRVWTKASWVQEHANNYSQTTIRTYKKRQVHDQNEVFFQLLGDSKSALWFIEGIEKGIFERKYNPQAATYLEEMGLSRIEFRHSIQSGIILSNRSMSEFLSFAKAKSSKLSGHQIILFQAEPMIVASLIGYLAVLIISLTGLRVCELQQLNLEKSFQLIKLPIFNSENGVWDDEPNLAHIIQVFTKGKDDIQKSYIPEIIINTITKYCQIYRKFHNEKLKPINCLQEKFFRLARYYQDTKYTFIFQWNFRQMSNSIINKCIYFTFLNYPIIDEEGEPIALSCHLLRHGFAGYLRNKKGVSLERVAALLHHINYLATEYYSQDPDDTFLLQLNSIMNETGDLLGIDPGVIRNYDDVRRFEEECLKRFGALRKTIGGKCGSYCSCEVMSMCARCESFIPVPSRRHEIVERISTCEKAAGLYEKLGKHLLAERERLNAQDWKLALAEVDEWNNVILLDGSSPLDVLDGFDATDNEFLTPKLLPPRTHGDLSDGTRSQENLDKNSN